MTTEMTNVEVYILYLHMRMRRVGYLQEDVANFLMGRMEYVAKENKHKIPL